MDVTWLFDKEMNSTFKFIRNRKYVDGDLALALTKTTPADPATKYVPGYEFEMRNKERGRKVGIIRLRIGRTRPLIGWCGHIGYEVDAKHRGQRYAARS